mmetsp:Transcript_109468/g.172596  ORF Transcript_109468/g.172596 Transcript_109468/m.172596 type:complete len:96 (-) Transcript_109468:154-441(-)
MAIQRPDISQAQRPGYSIVLYVLLLLSSSFVASSLTVGEISSSTVIPAFSKAREERCSSTAFPATKFLFVAGAGFLAGGALTIREPLASALLHGM